MWDVLSVLDSTYDSKVNHGGFDKLCNLFGSRNNGGLSGESNAIVFIFYLVPVFSFFLNYFDVSYYSLTD